MGELATFRVDVCVGGVNGGGKLVVERGRIVLVTDRVIRAFSPVTRIVHTDGQVTLVKARLVPPWFNTSVVLHDNQASGYAVTWLGARKRLRASLKAAGFEVKEVATWFSLGGGRVASSTPRRRWLTSGPGRVGLVLFAAAGAAAAIIAVSHSLLFVAFAVACAALAIVPIFRS